MLSSLEPRGESRNGVVILVIQPLEPTRSSIPVHRTGGVPVANLRGTPGTAVSHGCVRLASAHITWLAARIVSGTPVTITR